MTDTLRAITQMNNDQFRDLVDRDLRHKTTEAEARTLRSLTVIGRWHATLVGMSKSVEGQLSATKQDYAAERSRFTRAILQLKAEMATVTEEYASRRAATLRFRSGLEETLTEAQFLLGRQS